MSTYADYLTWPEDERWEIIDAAAYMQAAPSPIHQEILGELFARMSPSSIKMDRFIKFNKYEKAGVQEYWIVEPEGKLVSVFKLKEDDQIEVSIFADLIIDLKSVFPNT